MAAPRTVEIRTATGTVLARRCVLAATPWLRLRGLLGRPLPAGTGLLLPRTRSVHTWGMRYPIDVLFLDGEDVIVRIVGPLAPWRAAGARAARATLELPAGTAAAAGLAPGDRLLRA